MREGDAQSDFLLPPGVTEEAAPAFFGGDVATPRRPLNRRERRALEKERKRRRFPPSVPPPVPGEGSESASETREEGRIRSKVPPKDIRSYLLDVWSSERGPLFEDTRSVVLRALSYAACLGLSRTARDLKVRKRAGGTVVRHGKLPKGAPASSENLAAARRLLLSLIDLSRDLEGRSDLDRTERLCDRLRQGATLSPCEQLALYGWAELLEGVLFCKDETLQFRCARMILNDTLPEARKIGEGPAPERTDEEKELLEAIRAERDPQQSVGARRIPNLPASSALEGPPREASGLSEAAEAARAPP